MAMNPRMIETAILIEPSEVTDSPVRNRGLDNLKAA
jgi:hypothetical protein